MSSLPHVSMRQLLEAGVHFGHTPRRWNPKMERYIFGVRSNVHIIDLQQTVPLLKDALGALKDVASTGGRILFVGTKHQASPIVAAAAERCGQYFINHRWLGGMLTNWNTVSKSINRLKRANEQLEQDDLKITKKERLRLMREKTKLDAALGGIMSMGGVPDMVVVIDVNKDALAIQECNKLKIPVVAILDTNTSPEGITYRVPGNDDAIKAIELYCHLFSGAVLSGLQDEMAAAGVDLGGAEAVEPVLEEMTAEAAEAVTVEIAAEAVAESADATKK